MSAEENSALARRVVEEAINGRRLEVLDEVIADDYVEHTPLPPGFPEGRDGLRQAIATTLNAFPDFQYTIDDEIVEGDKIVHRLTATGTHERDFLGIPATGKRATWGEIHMGRIWDGKSVDHWAQIDQLGMLQQLGAIPSPQQS
jgi:predicted ester cyclase